MADGLLGGIGLGLMALLPAQPADMDIVSRMVLCGMGFGLFQSPNNHTIVTSAPATLSGAASGMLAEQGCLEYAAAVDAEGLPPPKGSLGADTFTVIEKWATLADLQVHGASAHMTDYTAKTKALTAARMIHSLQRAR
ncbi:hypothetical protein GCM10027082_22000 [Comamonas humi]